MASETLDNKVMLFVKKKGLAQSEKKNISFQANFNSYFFLSI